MAKKTCRRLSQRDQELLCEFVRKSSTCAACQEPEYVQSRAECPRAGIFPDHFLKPPWPADNPHRN
ncbi:uncharacterized protein [Drosophila takahashii]|uniref:uncharacterized protein n=1 Tax=Drosophila takahashii TaxID=29030 RepID=UPI0007E73EC5